MEKSKSSSAIQRERECTLQKVNFENSAIKIFFLWYKTMYLKFTFSTFLMPIEILKTLECKDFTFYKLISKLLSSFLRLYLEVL